MKKITDIPVVEMAAAGLVGPGTQVEGDMDILNLPSGGMNIYQPPILPEPDELDGVVRGFDVLTEIMQHMRDYKSDAPTHIVDISDLNTADLDFVNQGLGEGEVSITVDGISPIRIQESVLAGLWRIQHFDDHDQLIRDELEVAAIPSVVISASFADANNEVELAGENESPNVLNSPTLLVEINDELKIWKYGDDIHVINLTLLPLSDDDLLLLGSRLGVGPVTILSRGYGNCRIGSTAKNNVWWIKYFNSEDKLILNTIEISRMPEVAMAAEEDIADSAARLDEILGLYR